MNPGKPKFTVRRFRNEDAAAYLELFEGVFGAQRSHEHWVWQSEKNPTGKRVCYLAVAETGRLVGHFAVIPTRMCIYGKEVLAGQAVDGLVHADFRGCGVFEAMVRACFAELREQGFALVYGFPNEMAFPVWIKKFGWKHLYSTRLFFRRLSLRHALARAIPIPALVQIIDRVYRLFLQVRITVAQERDATCPRRLGWTIRESDQVPAGYEMLWRSTSSQPGISLWKDTAYFVWRYEQNPSKGFRFFSLRYNQELVAVAVVLTANGLTHIVDLVVRDRSLDGARQLIRAVESYAISMLSDRLIFSGRDAGFFDSVFEGFSVYSETQNKFCVGSLNSDPITQPELWTICEGDSDAV